MNALQFTTHNDGEIEFHGTCLQGCINATHKELCAIFGQPHDGDGYKVDAEWDVRFGDGTVATVYNWKDGPNYNGKDGTPVEQIKDWHVGGLDRKALEHIEITLQLHREMHEEKNPVEEFLSSTKDILTSLKANRGENYSRTVYVAHLVKKQMDLFALVLQGAQSKEPAPPGLADILGNAMSTLSAHIISEVTEIAGVCQKNRDEARELMQWADRLSDGEASVLQKMVTDYRKGAH